MRLLLAIVCLLTVFIAAAPASADLFGRGGGQGLQLQTPYLPAQRADEQRQENRGMSPDEAARRAQQQNGGGRVLAVEPAGNGYRVKLLRDGEVRVFFIQ